VNRTIVKISILFASVSLIGCERKPSIDVGLPQKTAKGNRLNPPELPNPAGKAVLEELGVNELKVPRNVVESKANAVANGAKKEIKYERPKKWIDEKDLPYEFWEVQFVGNRPVGYLHQRVGPSLVGSAGIFRIDVDTYRRVKIDSKVFDQRLNVMTIEEIDGGLRTIEAVLKQGDDVTRIDGNVILESLRLQIQKSGSASGKEIPWGASMGGPFADVQSLRGDPLEPGEKRSFSWLDPITGDILKTEFKAGQYIQTPLLDGVQHRLLEVKSRASVGDRGVESTLWVNDVGEVLKSYNADLDIRSFRCDRSLAESIRDGGICESIKEYSLALSKPIENYETEEKIRYKLELEDILQSSSSFPSRTNQVAERRSSLSLQLTVFPMNEKSTLPDGVTPELKIDEAFSKPSPVIQSDDPYIKKIAKEFVADATPDRTKLEKLRLGVYRWLKNKTPFSSRMASAAEAARTQSGDCTEHAMLFAAVVRSLGVPARIAGGLVYNGDSEKPAMIYHTWTEVYGRDRWVSIDASIEASRTNATYIKFVDSALSDQNPYVVMLPILSALKEMKISIDDSSENSN
jgi:Transglutaminase-like superfamily